MIKTSKMILLWMIIFIVFNSSYIAYANQDMVLPSGLTQSELPLAIEAYIEEHEDTTAGLAISIFNDKDTFYQAYHGYGDSENEILVNKDTVFEWGSATKLLVWVSVLQLWEQGKIEFDQDIRTYLPEGFLTKSNDDEKITMLNLMHHDSGWQEVIVNLFVENIEDIQDLKSELQKIEPEQIYPVGKIKAYSNWGTALAAYIVEEITGQEFYKYVHDNIFIALDMKNTALLPDLSDNSWVKEKREEIKGYTNENKVIEKNFYHIPLYPAGMATSTMEDFKKFGQALTSENQKLFSDNNTLYKLLTPTSYYGDTEYPRIANGFWFRELGVPVLGHGGNTAAFSSFLLIDPVSKTSIVVMTNQANEQIYNYQMMPLIFGEFNPKISSGFYSNQEDIKGRYQMGRTILNGHGKLYSFFSRIKIEDNKKDELVFTWPGESYSVYEFQPNLYNLDGALYHVGQDQDNSIIIATAYGDSYKLDQAQIIKEYLIIISGVLAFIYSLFMLIITLVKYLMNKKRNKSFEMTFLDKYNLTGLVGMFIVLFNVLIMVLKFFNHSTVEAIKIHVYLSFVFMIILLVYNVILPFVLRKENLTWKMKRKYILTGIAGLIISFNIYFWQLYLL